jgi:hypothetical protein
MKPLACSNPRHTPARCGAAGVISLLGGFGGPHPHCGCFDLSREINEDKNELVPIKTSPLVFPRPYVWSGIGGFILAVLQHLEFLQRDQTTIHHVVKNRQEFVDLLF